ncbi:MAG: 30S ribosomal protein S4 [Candidatus Chisholmbacteria bacterium]|nr:30S ribosomal protein S4 [Candidatus Chisholmbacteria bacterium]
MARIMGPRNKRARHIGEDLGLRSKSEKLARRLGIPPGQHGQKGRRRTSEFALQLREKQKVRFVYGVMERQLRRYVAEALKARGKTGEMLLQALERRLDNVVYRLGLAPTRAAARQLISHGHGRVNNARVSIPSYRVSINDIIGLSSTALATPGVKDLAVAKDQVIPGWLRRKAAVGQVVRLPVRDDILEPITEQLIVEFYSR